MYIRRDAGQPGRIILREEGEVVVDVTFDEDGRARCTKEEGRMLTEKYEGVRIEGRESSQGESEQDEE